ncbi:hypothetical protein SISSUDRAFT_1004245 [Sistotremastrum suecicum HHB10207 ss-3]|uniref:Hsp90 chaperone protein kinase-targeting subunit n=1 Tax=Sistotremastrum suecicum HHB10207 ss-3 TaxID=1314776 RepID=A0A166DT36_9AGAM|nr:hypothetical protein SISSUDRAFT_1004245 [Sistotremastrum suecicum HHB10207 ss-3]
MPLNYSKWDQLELSDDSDIEGHPNVDKKSLIRWKQRDIHEKREIRKANIAKIRAELKTHSVLHPRLTTFTQSLPSKGLSFYSSTVEQLQKNPSPDKPTDVEGQPTYDAMIVDVLLRVKEEVMKELGKEDEERVVKALVKGLEGHLKEMEEFKERREKELESELKEQAKHITSDDLHDGWDSHYVPPTPEPAPLVKPKVSKEPAKKSTKTTTEYEVLNPKSSSSSTPAPPPPTAASAEEEEEDEEDPDLPELTPGLRGFAKIPLGEYERSFEYIQKHRDVVLPGAYDALLVEAWSAQTRGETKYSKQCVHQALLLQYCEKLGTNGVGLFFKKMIEHAKPAEPVFRKDVDDTHAHIVRRVKETKTEPQASGKETIQLFPEGDGSDVAWYIPDGPPPPNLILEGPGTEDLSVDEVREVLENRWQIFSSFSPVIQEALKANSLDKLNKVLLGMTVEEAEELVEKLQDSGMLTFAGGGVQEGGPLEPHLAAVAAREKAEAEAEAAKAAAAANVDAVQDAEEL